MNLLYHRWTNGMAADDVRRVDEMLADAAVELDATKPPAPPRRHVPGTAPSFRPPKWWRGDRAAWRNTMRAAEQHEPAALAAAKRREGM